MRTRINGKSQTTWIVRGTEQFCESRQLLNACQLFERGSKQSLRPIRRGEPTAEQLARFFHLDDADRELIVVRRGDHNRLGFAVQLCTVRFLGTFLEDARSVPAGAIINVARQLDIADPSCHELYCGGEQRWEHAAEIRTRYGYQDFSAGSVQFRLNR